MKKTKKPAAPPVFRWNRAVGLYAWDIATGTHVPTIKSDKEIIGNLSDPEYARAVSRVLIELIELAEKK
jgi:hypothetical protein